MCEIHVQREAAGDHDDVRLVDRAQSGLVRFHGAQFPQRKVDGRRDRGGRQSMLLFPIDPSLFDGEQDRSRCQ
ncbi:hypothetical protein COO72_08720 [Bifidobacterium callitrichos]|nr:hypothetical protein COO72_08720 [Bifidobacterium callitrichos]